MSTVDLRFMSLHNEDALKFKISIQLHAIMTIILPLVAHKVAVQGDMTLDLTQVTICILGCSRSSFTVEILAMPAIHFDLVPL